MTGFAAHALALRGGGPDDIALIAAMHAESWASAYRGLLPDHYLNHQVSAERLAHWHQRLPALPASGGALTIAECKHQAVGFICIEAANESGSVLVDNLHARPSWRGLGIGSVLLAHAKAVALRQGANALHLEVLEGNLAARGFYGAQGFLPVAISTDRMAGVDIVHLRLSLPLAPSETGAASAR